jgi:hypothetical protein
MKTNKNMFIGRRLLRLASIIQAVCLISAFILTGCASTKISNREILVTEKLPRPAHIWVYDFASSPADVPSDSSLAGTPPADAQTEEEAAVGRQLGISIAAQLVEEIKEMGLPAEHATAGAVIAVNDITIRGYLVSVEEGSAGKRMALGFGSGNSELKTIVEGYHMTDQGLRKLGSGELNATGSKGPGAAVGGAAWLITGSPVGLIVGGSMKVYGEASGSSKIEGRAKQTAKEIGEQIKIRCQYQGWID